LYHNKNINVFTIYIVFKPPLLILKRENMGRTHSMRKREAFEIKMGVGVWI